MIRNIKRFIRSGIRPVIKSAALALDMDVRQLEAVALWVAAIFYLVSRMIMFPMLEADGPEFTSECIFSFVVGICLALMAYATTIPKMPGAEEAAKDIAENQRGTLGWKALLAVHFIFCLVLLGVVFSPVSLLTWSMTGDVYMKAVFSMLLRVVAGIIFIFLMGGFSEKE